MKLIDTTVAIDFLRGTPAAVELMTELVEDEVTIGASELTRFELLAGVRPDEVEPLELFSSVPVWLGVDEEISRVAGDLAREHKAAFSGIDGIDYLIAATARVIDADLLTTNVKHFPMFPQLRPPYEIGR